MKIRKGDKVKVTAGKDRGKEGTVEKVLNSQSKIIVAGANLYKKHLKRQSAEKKGQIIDIAKPLPLGSIALICPKCSQATRVGFKFEGEKKTRICRKCDQTF